MSKVLVDYEINMGGLFDDIGLENVNEEISGDNYRFLLDKALQQYHSRYDVVVINITEAHCSGNDRLYVEIDGEDATEDERSFIEHLAGKVFHNFEWVVENDTENA